MWTEKKYVKRIPTKLKTLYFSQAILDAIYSQMLTLFPQFLCVCTFFSQGEQGDKGDRGLTTTFKGDQFPTGIIEGPPGPPGPSGVWKA